jgi:DNA-binding NarL/FixJ family response regulator
MTLSVLIVDDHAVSRDGLRAWMEMDPDLQIVGEANGGEAALFLAETLHPDVVVMDCTNPGMSGLDITPLLRNQRFEIRVVILSMYDDLAHVRAAIQNGASAYILKEDVVAHLVKAVMAAASGQLYLSPGLGDMILPKREIL